MMMEIAGMIPATRMENIVSHGRLHCTHRYLVVGLGQLANGAAAVLDVIYDNNLL